MGRRHRHPPLICCAGIPATTFTARRLYRHNSMSIKNSKFDGHAKPSQGRAAQFRPALNTLGALPRPTRDSMAILIFIRMTHGTTDVFFLVAMSRLSSRYFRWMPTPGGICPLEEVSPTSHARCCASGKTQSAPGSMGFGRLRTFPEISGSRAGSYLVQCGFHDDETTGHASLFITVEARSRIHLNFLHRLHLDSQYSLRDSRFPRRSLFASMRPTQRSHTVEYAAWTAQRPRSKFIFNGDGKSPSRYKKGVGEQQDLSSTPVLKLPFDEPQKSTSYASRSIHQNLD